MRYLVSPSSSLGDFLAAANPSDQKDAPMAWVGFPPIPAQAGVSPDCGLKRMRIAECGLRN